MRLSGAASLKTLLMQAYGLKNYQIAGPAWMDSERYEIAAKIPEGATKEQCALMLRSLLAERFHLKAHLETRKLPIYELATGKNGPKLKESSAMGQNRAAGIADDGSQTRPHAPKLTKGGDGFPDLAAGTEIAHSYEVVVGGPDGVLYKLWARRETMQQLADRLSGQLNRAVIDRTQLKGQYDFTLVWTMESAGGAVPRTYPPPDQIEMHSASVLSDPGLSIFAAVQTQLGLRLESKKGPLEMLFVDKVEKIPAAN